jgi:chromatin segregation and condensation protein Rec8/ScpA/Scc1 (kleisin family)
MAPVVPLSPEIHVTHIVLNASCDIPLVVSGNGHGALHMKNISPLPSDGRRSFETNVLNKELSRRPDNVVTISSHAGWRPRRELHDDNAVEGAIAADSVDLARLFHEVLERLRRSPVLNMNDESATVGQMVDNLSRRFTGTDTPVRLTDLMRSARSERAAICMFLALLELVQSQALSLLQDRTLTDILVKKNSALVGC